MSALDLDELPPMPARPVFNDYSMPPRPSHARLVLQELAVHLGSWSAAFRFAEAFAGLTLQIPVPSDLADLSRQRRIAEALGQEISIDRARELAAAVDAKSWIAAAKLCRRWTGVDIGPWLRARRKAEENDGKRRAAERKLAAAALGRARAAANAKARREAAADPTGGGASGGGRSGCGADGGDRDEPGEPGSAVSDQGCSAAGRASPGHPGAPLPRVPAPPPGSA